MCKKAFCTSTRVVRRVGMGSSGQVGDILFSAGAPTTSVRSKQPLMAYTLNCFPIPNLRHRLMRPPLATYTHKFIFP